MDAPALALMMPILKRALNDRDSEGRKMASQVITNLFAISEEKVSSSIFWIFLFVRF